MASGPVLSDLPDIVPDWLVNLAALAWRIVAICALLVILWLLATRLSTVTASIAVAIVIAAFFAPYTVALRRRGLSKTAAAGVVWVAALVVVLGAVLLVALALLPYLDDVLVALSSAAQDLQSGLAAADLPSGIEDAPALLASASDATNTAIGQIAANAAEAVVIAILAGFLVFFFLQDGDRAWVWIFQAAGSRKRERITEAGEEALRRVGGYLRGTTVLSAIVAITDYVFMRLLGVPLAVPLTIIVFFSGYIPYFGGILATLLVLAVTYAALGAGPTIVMLALIAVRSVVIAYVARPAIYGRTVSIHPALVLVALPAGLELGGVIGMFAAVPVTAIILAVAGATVAILDPGPRPGLPRLVPGWLDRVSQWSWRILVTIALFGLFVAIFIGMPLVVMPVLLASILAATLEPGVSALVRRDWSRARAAAAITGGGFLGIVLVVALTLLVLVDHAGDIADGTTAGAAAVNTASGGQASIVEQAITQGAGALVGAVASVAHDMASLAVIVVLSVLLAFYFLRDGGRLWAGLMSHVQADVATDLDGAANRAVDVLGGYMFGTGVISFVGAASQFIIMTLLGVPLALPVFVLSFVLCFVPYIGGFISTGIAFLLTVAFGSPQAIVIMGIWTVVFNLVTGNVVGPIVYGKTVHLHPAVVLVAIPAGGAIAGILGMFFVVPLIGVVAATWRTVLGVIGLRRRIPESAPYAEPPEMAAAVPASEPGSA